MAYTQKELNFLKEMKAQGVSKDEAFKRLRDVQGSSNKSAGKGILQNAVADSKIAAIAGGATVGLSKLISGIGKVSEDAKGQLSRLAPGDQSADPNSFYNTNKKVATEVRDTWNKNTENFVDKVTLGARQKQPILSGVSEMGAPLLAGLGAESLFSSGLSLLSKGATASKFITNVATKAPLLSKYAPQLKTGAKILVGNTGYNVASEGELPSTISNAIALTIPLSIKVAGEKVIRPTLKGLAKSNTGRSVMENLTLSNFVDKTGLRNILAKVAKNGGDIVGQGDDELNKLALEGNRILGGKEGALGEDIMTGVVKKIQENIKPGTVKNQIQQMNDIGDKLSKTVSDDLSRIPEMMPSVPANNILKAIEENTMNRISKPELSKFKDVNGQWKKIFTTSEMDEIKKLSDTTFNDMFASEGSAKKAYLDLADSRRALKLQIEDTAKRYGIPDISSRNAEVALFKGLAESGKNASIVKRLSTIFARNPWVASIGLGSIGGVGGLIGSSYIASNKTGTPQWATGLAAITVATMLTKRFGSNEWTTKQAQRIFKTIGEGKMSTLDKYLETGKDVYRARAQKVADEITHKFKALPASSGKPLTSFPADFSPKVESQYAAANRGASIANAGSYQGKTNTSKKIPKISDEFAKFVKTSASRGGREISRYEKKILALLRKSTKGMNPTELSSVRAAEKEAKKLLDFFERNNLYNRYE